MADMTEDQIEAASEVINEAINQSPAMDPSKASQQDSLDFLTGVMEHCQMMHRNIKQEMGD